MRGQHKIDGLSSQDERAKPRGLWSNNLSLSEIAVVETIMAVYLERGCVEVSYESLHSLYIYIVQQFNRKTGFFFSFKDGPVVSSEVVN